MFVFKAHFTFFDSVMFGKHHCFVAQSGSLAVFSDFFFATHNNKGGHHARSRKTIDEPRTLYADWPRSDRDRGEGSQVGQAESKFSAEPPACGGTRWLLCGLLTEIGSWWAHRPPPN